MTNVELRRFIDNIFGWDLRDTIAKKAGLELDDQLWFKLHHPVTDQLINLMAIPILIAINYQK